MVMGTQWRSTPISTVLHSLHGPKTQLTGERHMPYIGTSDPNANALRNELYTQNQLANKPVVPKPTVVVVHCPVSYSS
eukprot:2146674-Amphidinium_carterae.1